MVPNVVPSISMAVILVLFPILRDTLNGVRQLPSLHRRRSSISVREAQWLLLGEMRGNLSRRPSSPSRGPPPLPPNVTRNGGVEPRRRSLSTSPSRTTLAASDPGVDHPQIPVFLDRNRQDDAVRPALIQGGALV